MVEVYTLYIYMCNVYLYIIRTYIVFEAPLRYFQSKNETFRFTRLGSLNLSRNSNLKCYISMK